MMTVGERLGLCALTICLFLISAKLSNAQNDCRHIKRYRFNPPSGVYTVRPSRHHAAFKVYCDMTGPYDIAWTKILQIATPYNVTRNAFGNVTTGPCFAKSAKLSDLNINLMARRRADLNFHPVIRNHVGFRLTARDTTTRLFMWRTYKEFNDLLAGWGIFEGSRKQCLRTNHNTNHYTCFWNSKEVNLGTLDTLRDGTGSKDDKNRFFTDYYGGNTQRRCWVPNSPKRCVNTGVSMGHIPHYKVELWMG